MEAGLLTEGLFATLVVVMAGVAAAAVMRVPGLGSSRTRSLALAILVLGYLVVPGVLAARGALDRYTPLPAPGLVVVLVLTLLTIGTAFSAFGGRLSAQVGLAALVGFQVFRVPVELLLHRLYVDGVIPVEMTYAGRNFDIVSGLTGGALGLWLMNRRVPRAVILAWNLLGLALLVNIVAVAVLATPVPFRHFVSGPPNLLPSTFPFVWLPTFLVQLALFGHLLVFRRLRAS